MRKFGAIAFLTILLFQWWGYKVVVYVLEEEANYQLEQRIEAGNYAPSELVELRIPLNLPYSMAWKDYDQNYGEGGEVVINGEIFQYLKRSVLLDTLYLTCIYHTEKNKLQRSVSNYVSETNGLQPDGKTHGTNADPVLKLLISEYLSDIAWYVSHGIKQSSGTYNPFLFIHLPQHTPSIPVPPPRC